MNRTLTDKERNIIAVALWNHKRDACKVCELEVCEEYEEYKDEVCRLFDLFDLHKNITVSSSQSSPD